jgi:hypothetical protein
VSSGAARGESTRTPGEGLPPGWCRPRSERRGAEAEAYGLELEDGLALGTRLGPGDGQRFVDGPALGDAPALADAPKVGDAIDALAAGEPLAVADALALAVGDGVGLGVGEALAEGDGEGDGPRPRVVEIVSQ